MGLDASEPHSEQSTLREQDMTHFTGNPAQASSERALRATDNEKNDVETPSPEPEKPASGPPPPPNGGLQAWLHTLGGFMLFVSLLLPQRPVSLDHTTSTA